VKRIKIIFGIVLLILSISFGNVFAQHNKIKTVVIDAGHGGHDPGAVGRISKEKDIALIIALKVGKYIEENFPDVKVIYTRKTDVFIELYNRPKIANKNNADLFISIHCNACGSSKPNGTETFVMGLDKSKANLEVAKRENASILMEDDYETQYEGYSLNSPESNIIFSLYQNVYLDKSIDFASKVQRQLTDRVGRFDRGVKQAIFLVLWKTTMPSVLIETGFMSNPEEEKYLNSEKGQTYIASAIYRAFKEYKKEYEGGESKPQTTKSEDKENLINKTLAPVDKKNTEDVNSKNLEKDKNISSKIDVYFSVQFATSSKEKSLNAPEFKGLQGVDKYYNNGLYKYIVGKEKILIAAVELQKQLKEKGFKDSFVVAFNNGKRISPKEAVEKLKMAEIRND